MNSNAIELRRDTAEDGRVYWHLADECLRTIYPFLDYIIHCVDVVRLNYKTVEGKAYSLKKWYQYLIQRHIETLEANDEVLSGFREWLVSRNAPNSSGISQARRRTVNLDLRNVYSYYAWLQKQRYESVSTLLGPDSCQITSSLLLENAKRGMRSDRRRYPLVFSNAGEGSKHRLGFVPGEEERAALTEFFYDTLPIDLAKRNCLIFELAWRVGWRRGSILSLTADQFCGEILAKATERIMVRPASQKFRYSNTFAVDLPLAMRVHQYITTERKRILEKTCSTAEQIFLNTRTGVPLTPRALSSTFSKARLALGWPVGAGLHAWRRGFANAYIERELDARLELGLDTSGETIAISVASAMGQQSLSSQAAYIRDAQRRIRGTTTMKDKEENSRLSDENATLRAEIAKLRKMLQAK